MTRNIFTPLLHLLLCDDDTKLTKICADALARAIFFSIFASILRSDHQALMMMLAAAALAAAQTARRGPPRGPIKADQSHFFGKEGDQGGGGGVGTTQIFLGALLLAVAFLLVKLTSSTNTNEKRKQ